MLFHGIDRNPAKIKPGVAHVPGWLDTPTQQGLVQQLRDEARLMAGTPIAMQKPVLKSGGQMSVFMLNLGHFWDHQTYRYVDRMGATNVRPVPQNLLDIAHGGLRAAADVAEELQPWTTNYHPDMALINFYPPGATMGMHQDAYETTFAPIVSLSIGDEAVFRIGSTEHRNKPWDDIALLSGDLVVFGGPNRQAFHGVPETRPGTLDESCGLKEGRINITFRQVYPH
ncbi:alpha-ketoglutarate-dependent dioxygenase AlkB family protein [Corynebacterium casei]|uniref:alpha-ketoglutarate-dependent dioxygenase AlkB family protein n=1 Tax=Corynebacterium casei TaxID=160386 RepID=UPI0009D344D5|nr:alpha-ketoglutarate-dependent dioxygenase AlkB [Corynebacterium casei]MDN5739905.1 alpha-ketoglutarate-dependent dioxygenase AlkB [Corynebacterium casei]MDN5783713.1 alpha-ketoglutarate-dependent dioxygenase AlkB [Corynebacterium casei]MDN5826189.1 alpha-ketoglutarate-dependent dioxygenase AlkB [Corynebacterium casei]MDN5901938.1 alpha-ketoglutarate-dependent dioxygenase AlkB [Corynebacterium casei]MDN6415313.1 alpha-ketoglutarate-dependent dioxygenase AlkB [Corynebacterium casei]